MWKRKKSKVIFIFFIIFIIGILINKNIIYMPAIPAVLTVSEESEWNLILVNKKFGIPNNCKPELMELSNGKKIDSRIYCDLQEMFDDMRSVGVYPVVVEGYRTSDEQKQIMKDKINEYINYGHSKSEAKKLASCVVAKVNYSEHQLGLAIDINADEMYSSNEDVYNWLAENAYKYGFILRYPENKTDITGFDFEPWHYRYVGRDVALEIYSQNICLEEYLNKK